MAKLLDFLKQAFGATENLRLLRPDGAIMHADVKIGDSIILMGEPMGAMQPMPGCLDLYVTDTYAVSVAEPADLFYGDRRAGVRDASGNLWWISTHKEDVPPEELRRRREAMLKQ